MKHVQPTEIIGQPTRADQQVACPHCQERAMLMTDGSVVCFMENKWFSPEAGDGEKFAMRQEFDRANGITATDRLNATMVIHQGALSDRPTGNHG